MRFEGKRVWIGQISRDIGVRFTTKTITTHKIDADVDFGGRRRAGDRDRSGDHCQENDYRPHPGELSNLA